MYQPDQIINTNCVDGLREVPDSAIPLTVTSPPYDDLREYGGHPFTMERFQVIANQLYRVTGEGGIVVWVVRDQVIPGKDGAGSPGLAACCRRPWGQSDRQETQCR